MYNISDMDKERLNESLNTQPDLLDCGFPETKEPDEKRNAGGDKKGVSDILDPEVWFDTLDLVPEEEKPTLNMIISKSINKALDRIEIREQRYLPSEN